MRELVACDGSNVGWKKDLVISLKRMANLRVLQEQEEEAEKLYKEARDIQHALE